ncbi:aminotransferase class V-fold PLP-dependent enzyme [Desulfogranum japonicum]|uniref:aminotransferase class V-fold PLP-dependent enzyme n=1 Tax=Desulfogranum japonicum TaxID=231447 RepID=UPI0004071E87|nr:aminotransferase class V-fold PLP-dependent enzyme [Desulfogranum japonicum]
MNLPVLKILIIENDTALLDEISRNILRCVDNFARTDLSVETLNESSVTHAIQCIEEDIDIQAVVLSWDIDAQWNDSIASNASNIRNNTDIITAIKAIRVSLPIYILGDDTKGLDIINESDDIESFFFRDDIIQDPESILGYILNDFDDRCQTPFWDAYKKYITESNDSWHTPGHSGGLSFRNSPYIRDFYQFYGRNVFVGDLSVSVDSLGSLTEGTHAIGKAQEAAAYTFESTKTFFITNGSSTSNKIILQTLLRSGDKVIVDRNCHKSIHYGILQARANPIYLSSILSPEFGIFAPPALDEIKEKIEQHQGIKLIVLTGCTYDGLLIDVRQVVKMAHAKGIKVFIDEAWFAYSLFHPAFRYYSAINAGADYITHSAHKVVSAFSQASYIHVNDPDFDADFFHEIYSMYSSTSPKYQIIASLDVCHKQLEMEGYGLLKGLLGQVEELKTQMRSFKHIKILEQRDFQELFPHFATDNVGHDSLKILIDVSGLEYSTSEIHRYLLDEIGLEIEKFTHSTILVLLTLGGTRSKVIRLYNALKKLDQKKVTLPVSRTKKALISNLPDITLHCLPADAFFGPRKCLDFDNAIGKIAAGLVTPYPPGIPLLVPGQLIEQATINYLRSLVAQNTHIQGMYGGQIYVVREQVTAGTTA